MKYLREITCERVGLNEHTPHQVTAYSDNGKLLVDNGYYRGSYTHPDCWQIHHHKRKHTCTQPQGHLPQHGAEGTLPVGLGRLLFGFGMPLSGPMGVGWALLGVSGPAQTSDSMH